MKVPILEDCLVVQTDARGAYPRKDQSCLKTKMKRTIRKGWMKGIGFPTEVEFRILFTGG